MPLSDIAIRTAKPGTKPIKLSDERGLFLLVQPSGGKLWRLKYRVAGKEKKLSLGCYPDVLLKEARERAGEARKLLAAGTDPSEKKRSDRLEATLKAAITFKAVADEYIAKSEREGRAAHRPLSGKCSEVVLELTKRPVRWHRSGRDRSDNVSAAWPGNTPGNRTLCARDGGSSMRAVWKRQ